MKNNNLPITEKVKKHMGMGKSDRSLGETPIQKTSKAGIKKGQKPVR